MKRVIQMFDGHHQPVPGDALPRRFVLEWTRKLDKPKGKSTTSVLKGISDDLEAFYGNVVEHLSAYVAPAPKLPKDHAAAQPLAETVEQPTPVLEPPSDAVPDAQPYPAELVAADPPAELRAATIAASAEEPASS